VNESDIRKTRTQNLIFLLEDTMSKYSRFLHKARNNADFSGLRAGIKLIVMILVVVYSLVGMIPTSVLAAGTTYYVDKTNGLCSDTGPGTSAQPFCTISKGASVARSGDTVRVLAGTYAETVSISTWSGTLGNPITFSAESGVIVTGSGSPTTGSAFRIFGLNYITIDGFTVNSTAETGIYVSGDHFVISNNHVTGTASHGIFAIESNNVTISNNQVSTSGGSGIYLKNSYASTVSGNTSDHNNPDGIRLTTCNTVTVSNNTTFANYNNGIAAIGTILLPSYSNTILHNIVYANVDSGLQFDTGSHDNSVVGNLSYNNGDHGIDNEFAPNQTIVGNTFQGNYTSGINLESSSTGATVANNILVDNGLAPGAGRKPYNIYVDSTSYIGTTLNYNLYYLTSPYYQQIYWNITGYISLAYFQGAEPTQEVNGLQANPLFVAPAPPATNPPSVVTGNYRLKAGSPAIDNANSSASGEPTTDIEGNARFDDPATANPYAGYDDRGAYEFQHGFTGTTITVSTSGSPSTYGAPVTFTATVDQMAATGTVNFYDGALFIGSGTLATVNGHRQASYTTGGIQLTAIASPHSTITATYLGDSTYDTSFSSAISQAVNPKALRMSGLSVPASRVYDRTTAAVVSGGPGSLLASETAGSGTTGDGRPYTGDTVNITGTATGTYNSMYVATATSVSFGGLSLTGAQSGNYTLTIQSPASATISPKPLTITGVVANSKTYDRTTTATFNLSSALLVGVLSPDVVNIDSSSAAGMFANANAGTRAVTASGFGVVNNTNYTLSTQPIIPNATINPKTASVTALGNIKSVGTADPPLSTTNSGFLAGDLGAGKITFSASRDPGETVNTYDITPAAGDAGTGLLGNYNVTYNHGTFIITDKLIPTITVACGTNTVYYGNDISCTVTVVRPSGSDTPTGTVAWTTSDAGGFGVTTPCTLSTTVNGTATCSATYTPTAIGTGTHTVIATYSGDANFASKSGTKDVTVTAVNTAPIITEGASVNVNMSQDGSTTPFSLTLHATDVDGNTLTWSINTPAGHGTASASGAGTSKAISYTPALHYIGSDSFVVQVSDGHGGTDTIIVNVTISAVEPTPFTIFLPLILR
jgi:parallel beta-helix repeat protein